MTPKDATFRVENDHAIVGSALIYMAPDERKKRSLQTMKRRQIFSSNLYQACQDAITIHIEYRRYNVPSVQTGPIEMEDVTGRLH